MSDDTEVLQQIALENCPPSLYYLMLDSLDELSSDELGILSGVCNPNVIAFLDLYEDCEQLIVNGVAIERDDTEVHPLSAFATAPFITLHSDHDIVVTFGDIECASIHATAGTMSIKRGRDLIEVQFIP